MENESNLIISALDRANACTMRACDDFEHTVRHAARLLSARIPFRTVLAGAPVALPIPLKTA